MSIKKNDAPVPEQVTKNVTRYLEEHNLGTLVMVYRASEYPADNYLYHVIAGKGNSYSVWTSWNETTQCLNHGHYGLTLSQAVAVHYNFFLTLSEGHVLAPVAKEILLETFSAKFVGDLLFMEDDITGNTFLADVTEHFFEEVFRTSEKCKLELSDLSSVIVRKCIEKELAARLGIE